MSDTPKTDEFLRQFTMSRYASTQDLAQDKAAQAVELAKKMERALHAILDTWFAEDCQECAIGQSEAWKQAKALLGRK